MRAGRSCASVLIIHHCDTPNIILTSSPQSSGFNLGNLDLELDNRGLAPDEINFYIEKDVKDQDLILWMKEMIDQQPLLQGLLGIPIQLDAFYHVCKGGSSSTDV